MTSTSTPPTPHRLHVWVLKLLSLGCGLAVVSCIFAAVDDGQLLWLAFALVPAPIGYGLWRRRRWGRTLALLVCWLVILSPPFLFVGALLGGRGRDSIGHGLVAVMSVVWLLTLTPLAGAVVFALTRPAARGQFSPSDAPLSATERTVMSVLLGVLLLAEILVLANVQLFDFALKLL